MRQPLVVSSILCSAALLLSACGGGEEPAPEPPAPTTTAPKTDLGKVINEAEQDVRAAGEQAKAAAEEMTEKAKEAAESFVASAEELALGARAWGSGNCAMCHGIVGGGGQLGPNLRDATWVNCDGTVEGILKVLREGVAREQIKGSYMMAMPPATEKVTKEKELDALAKYVKSLSEG